MGLRQRFRQGNGVEVEEEVVQRSEMDMQERQQEQYEREVQDENNNVTNETPLKLLHEIKDKPTPKGFLPVNVNGRVIDLHMLEVYALSNSPLSLKTLLRYYNARAIAHIKSYDKMEQKLGKLK